MKRCSEIYFEFFVGLSFTVAVALLCFLSIRDNEEDE